MWKLLIASLVYVLAVAGIMIIIYAVELLSSWRHVRNSRRKSLREELEMQVDLE